MLVVDDELTPPTRRFRRTARSAARSAGRLAPRPTAVQLPGLAGAGVLRPLHPPRRAAAGHWLGVSMPAGVVLVFAPASAAHSTHTRARTRFPRPWTAPRHHAVSGDSLATSATGLSRCPSPSWPLCHYTDRLMTTCWIHGERAPHAVEPFLAGFTGRHGSTARSRAIAVASSIIIRHASSAGCCPSLVC